MVPGMNPDVGMLCGTNVYAIGTGKKRYLVDAGEKDIPRFLSNLKQFVTDQDCIIEAIFVTHSHFDHMEGAMNIIELMTSLGKPAPKVYKRVDGCETELQRLTEYPELKQYLHHTEEGDEHKLGGSDCSISLYPVNTPGHTSDHLCFLLKESFPGGKNMFNIFTGDHIIGASSTFFLDYVQYFQSLVKT